ncbi:right-handed parallel beta-helix repeat-containing protein [Natronorarus salvus]|uniref:right-handed parallel beta-helix repeat-containing protein n=1 Tax=Natronorarus salvus TaxID=3117733 RepID=UPI002F264D10
MSDETEHKGYNKPDHGEQDWHNPLNENFVLIDSDIHEIEQLIEESGDIGATAKFEKFLHDPTEAPVKGPITEAFNAGSLDHYGDESTDLDRWSLVTSDIEGDHMLRFDAPDGLSDTESYHLISDVSETHRGFSYSAYVRGEDNGSRGEFGFAVLTSFSDGTITDGFVLRMNLDRDSIEIMEYSDGFVGGTTADVNLSADTLYRLELDVEFDGRLIGRIYDTDDNALQDLIVDPEQSDVHNGGFGWYARVGSEDEWAEYDFLTKQPLASTPARVSGTSSNGGGSIEGTAALSTDILVYEDNPGEYVVLDDSGDIVHSGSNAVTALQQGIDATPTRGTICVRGHYNLDDEIEITDYKHLIGYGAHFECTMSSDPHIQCVAGTASSGIEVTDIDFGEEEILTLESTSGMEPGDLLEFYSDEEIDRIGTGDERPLGELHKIQSVDSDPFYGIASGEVLLMDTMEWEYDTSYDIHVNHIPADSVTIEGLRMTGPEPRENYRAIRCRQLENPVIESVDLETFGGRGVMMDRSYMGEVRNSRFSDMREQGAGYGVSVQYGSAHTKIHNCRFYENRHGVAHVSGGSNSMNRRTHVSNCRFLRGQSSQIDTHGDEWNCRISDCMFSQPRNFAIHTGAREIVIDGCEFYCGGSAGLTSDRGEWVDQRIIFINNKVIRGSRNWLMRLDDDGYDLIKVHNNEFFDISVPVLRPTTSENIDHIHFTDNFIKGINNQVLHLGNLSDGKIGEVTVSGNYSENCNSTMYRFRNIRNLRFTNNEMATQSGFNYMIELESVSDSFIANNVFRDHGNKGGIELNDAEDFQSENNVIMGNVGYDLGDDVIENSSAGSHEILNNFNF